MNIIRGIRAFSEVVRARAGRQGSGGANYDGGFARGIGDVWGSGSGGWAQTSYGEYYPRSAIVYAAIKVRQDAIARLPLRVMRTRGANRMDRMDRIGGGRGSFHPHSFGKLRTGSNLPPSRGKGQNDLPQHV